MGGVLRTIVIIVVLVLGIAGAAYFFVPPVASRSQTVDVERPAQTVLARLASTPAETVVVEGVTTSGAAELDGNTVTAPVTFADGATGRVVYTVAENGDGSRVQVKLEQDLGGNPVDRLQIITGGDVAPLIEAAAAGVSTDLSALPNTTWEGLTYIVEEVQARPFFYVENCSDTSAESITSIITQATAAIPAVMRTNNLQANGELMAVEPRVVTNQYCYQVGYPYTGRTPRALLIGKVGQTPAGQVLRVRYTGTEADVVPQVYDRMDALLGAVHLDNPATREDDWITYEVYHDDATQSGGSRNRDIYYVVPSGVDIARVTALLPPAAALPADAPAAPAEAAPAAETPAATPAPATTP